MNDPADNAERAAKAATGDDAPLRTSKGWIAATVVLVGVGLAAPTIGVCSVLYTVGMTQTVG